MSTDGGSWAPFGPSGDDEERPPRREEEPPPPPSAPIREPDPEPVPFEEPPPVQVPPPAAAYQPPVAPTPSPASLNWPAPEPPPPPISQWPGAAHAPYGAPKKVASNATASLVLGIVGLVMCPLIASAAAIGLGNSAKREIRENPGQLGGESMATWGVALGWIGVAFGVLVILIIIGGAASV